MKGGAFFILLFLMCPQSSLRAVGFSGEAHDGGKHGGAVQFGGVFADVDVGGADLKSLAGAEDFGAGDEFFTIGGGKEVHFVFDGEDGGIGGHEGVGGVAAGAVGDGAGDSGMEIAMLLGEFGAKGDLNGNVAGRQFGKTGAEVLHDSLARETVMDAALKVWIGSRKLRMVSHEGEYSSGTATEQWARGGIATRRFARAPDPRTDGWAAAS
jgi:hypothetical protein